jgi:DNA recombination protein RmuC
MSELRSELSRSLLENNSSMRTELQSFSTQVGDRLKETSSTLQSTQTSVGARLDNAARVVADLQNKLGGLEESSKRIFDVGQGLKDLKDILQSPKLRGNMGEYFLEDLLRQILPTSAYSIQHTFKSGETVDAVIRLGDALVPVDSKFPLESFIRLMKIADGDPELRAREKKGFISAIKKHSDAIAKKYILPAEGTFDFAFMYIPAENVYYETIIRDDLMDAEGSLYSWLLNRRTIPVSPNSLYAYLQVIVLGLRGMHIQESAQEILRGLGNLSNDLNRTREDFGVLGKHLKNAGNAYDGVAKRIEKFSDRYAVLSEGGARIEASPVKVVTEEKLSLFEGSL